jgi:two-component system chemotaxis response regulator CheB
LREIRKTHPKLPVIMFSTLTSRGAETTLEALSAGASDYVTKPSNVGNVGECIARLETDLVPKIKIHCRHLGLETSATSSKPVAASRPLVPSVFPAKKNPVEIVCVGTSTGGPNALAEVFKNIPADFSVPVVIVQHMPPVFTAMLAERLTANCPLRFHEGVEGQLLEPGHAYIAPGGRHMEIQRVAGQLRVHLTDAPPENSCRPAVDVLFRSVVSVCGGNLLGVVMTGMGQDGMRGCEFIRERGGQVVVQDEASSVVWGMPGYVAQAGLADRVAPLKQIALEIKIRTQAGRRLVAA